MFDVRRGLPRHGLSLPGLLLPGLRRRDSGWAGPGVYGMLAIGALMLLGIAVAAPSGIPNQVRVAQLASVQLADDDGDQALFAASALAPGHSVTRCLEVGYTGPADQGMVRLAATDVTGPLAAALTVSVEIGTGGGFASCAGFSGASFYTGPLTGLAGGQPEAPGVPTGWAPAGPSNRTYRITVTLTGDNSVQGAASTATFQWLLTPSPVTPTPVTPSPTQPTPSQPTPAPPTPAVPTPAHPAPVEPAAPPAPPRAIQPAPAEPRAVPVPQATPSASAAPTVPVPATQSPAGGSASGQRAAKPKATAGGGAVATVKEAFNGLADLAQNLAPTQLAKGIETVVKDSVVVGTRVAKKHSGIPAVSALALGSFLLLQGRIDRADPKLALAPLWGESDLLFEEPSEYDESADPAQGTEEGQDAEEGRADEQGQGR